MLRRRSAQLLILAGSIALAYACWSPSELCACTPVPPHVAAYGAVTTAEGLPVGEAVVRLALYESECGVGAAGTGPGHEAVADWVGRYEISFYLEGGPDRGCLRGVATRPMHEDSVIVDVRDVVAFGPDRLTEAIRMDFEFP